MEIKFRLVGLNKHFNEIQIQEDLTTEKILNGETLTFFSNYNRGESGNCKFISEDLFSGLTSIDNSDAYLNDIIEYQNTEGKVFYSHLWFDKNFGNRSEILLRSVFKPYHITESIAEGGDCMHF